MRRATHCWKRRRERILGGERESTELLCTRPEMWPGPVGFPQTTHQLIAACRFPAIARGISCLLGRAKAKESRVPAIPPCLADYLPQRHRPAELQPASGRRLEA